MSVCENCGFMDGKTSSRVRCPCLDPYCDRLVCSSCAKWIGPRAKAQQEAARQAVAAERNA